MKCLPNYLSCYINLTWTKGDNSQYPDKGGGGGVVELSFFLPFSLHFLFVAPSIISWFCLRVFEASFSCVPFFLPLSFYNGAIVPLCPSPPVRAPVWLGFLECMIQDVSSLWMGTSLLVVDSFYFSFGPRIYGSNWWWVLFMTL